MNHSDLHGIIPAIVTPFDGNERFARPAFEQLIHRLYSAGVHGLYVCGQTGEGLQQSVSQRKLVAEAAVEASPEGKTVIIHVGAPSTNDAVELARHASEVGAHVVSSLPPAGAYSFNEIRDYYQAIAEASQVPLLIYYFPSMAPAIRTTGQVLDLCGIPNVCGLKFTDSDFFRLWCLRRAGAVAFNGSDEMMVAGLIMGANGGIGSTYNLMPEAFVSLYERAVAGDWNGARQMQDAINELIEVLLRYPVHAAIKATLKWSGIDCGHCIGPRQRLSPQEEDQLRTAVASTSLGQQIVPVSAGR